MRINSVMPFFYDSKSLQVILPFIIIAFYRLLSHLLVMPPTLKKLMGHIAFGACVGAWVGVSHFLYLL